jgi:hypothetical protein
MTTWADKSFALVAQGGYLDRLGAVYPAPTQTSQPLDKDQYNTLKAILDQSDDGELLRALLLNDRFPFRDPFVGFLRENPSDITSNPITVERICSRVRTMGLENIVKELEEPKEFNRQMGPLFRNWLYNQYSKPPDPDTFKSSQISPFLLDVSGPRLKDFANSIGCGLQKEPDFVAKVKGKYVVGESKFVGTEGGHQNRSFDDAMALASNSFKKAVAVAVLDGIVWIPNSGQMSRRLANYGGNALTALLLDDFLNSL